MLKGFRFATSDQTFSEISTAVADYSTHYMLNIDADRKATFITFATLNLIMGNLFRFIVLRSVWDPVEIKKPLNLMILADESIKVVGYVTTASN